MINKEHFDILKLSKFIILFVLILIILTACSEVNYAENGPVTTQDDIQPTQAVDAAVAQADEAENYNYTWNAENIQTIIEDFYDMNEVDETLPNYENDIAVIENMAQEIESQLEAQLTYEPIIAAQEAANIAGVAVNETYGQNKERVEITLELYKGYDDRLYWTAGTQVLKEGVEAEKTEALFQNNIESAVMMQIDATTGAIISIMPMIEYAADLTDKQAVGEMAECFVAHKIYDGGAAEGEWDETHESYDATMQKLKDELSTALDGSAILQGASIQEITHTEQLVPSMDGKTYESLSFDLVLSSGRELNAERQFYIAPYTNYDYKGYPMYAYRLEFDGGIERP